MPKPEDLISHITYDYFDGSDTTVEYANSSKIISYVDTSRYGRCFSFSPTEKMIKLGIKTIKALGLRQMSMLYFHTKGMFESQDDLTRIAALSYNELYLDLDFTVYEMLDFGGQPCATEPEFNQDDCTKTKLEKKSLEIFACTTPFGTNKEKICQDYETGFKVMELYKESMEKYVDNCYSPCSFLTTKAIKTAESFKSLYGYGQVSIKLKKNIQVFEAQYLYSILSMMAEVGGYVGLFLGISVNQVSTMFNVVLDRFDWIFNKSKRTY